MTRPQQHAACARVAVSADRTESVTEARWAPLRRHPPAVQWCGTSLPHPNVNHVKTETQDRPTTYAGTDRTALVVSEKASVGPIKRRSMGCAVREGGDLASCQPPPCTNSPTLALGNCVR